MSITAFNTPDDSAVPKGSERSAWWVMLPRAAGTAGNLYGNARLGVASADVLGGFLQGAAATSSVIANATDGWFKQLSGVTNASPAFVTMGNGTLLEWLPPRMDATFQAAPPFAEVIIFREILQSFASALNPVGHAMLHGFSLVGNLLTPNPPLTTGSWRGIAVVERQLDYVLAVKDTNPAVLIPLPTVDLRAARTKLEHRLYAPTPARVGRYELWVNDILTATVLGNAANFPHPTVRDGGWRPMPFLLNNPGTATTIGFRYWWGEIIVGPDSAGTY